MHDHLRPMFGNPITAWWRWFAWRPVETVDRGRVWLRIVWKRRIHKHNYLHGGPDFWFQYAVRPTVPYIRGNKMTYSETDEGLRGR